MDLRRVGASLALVGLWGVAGCGPAPANEGGGSTPDLSDLLTTAERTEFRATSSYNDVMAFLERVAAVDDRFHLTSYGTTSEDRSMPLLVIGDVADPSPETVRATGKVRVYLQGNIHAGEVCGKEALQMLVRDFAEGEYPNWTENMVLLVAPIYNADGNERFDLRNRRGQHGPVEGMGQRPNAQGYDLNRDHMKLISPEAQSVARLMAEYDPEVSVDLHTTNGSRHGYLLTYSPPLHPNTDSAIIDLLRDDLFPQMTENVKADHGWDYYYYGNVQGGEDGDLRGWYTFDHRPRFNNNYIGLRNRFALLSEAYAYASFEDRVMGSLYFVEEVLDYVHENHEAVQAAVAEADSRSLVDQELAVRAEFERSAEPVEILMGATEEDFYIQGADTVRMLLRVDSIIPEQMWEYGTFASTEDARVPSAYVILPEAQAAIDKVEAHGIRTTTLDTETTLQLDVFTVDSTAVSPREFQGVQERTIWGSFETVERTVPAGAVVVSTEQPLGRLAFTLLEPRSDDGLVNWALLDDVISVGSDYPILKTPRGAPAPN